MFQGRQQFRKKGNLGNRGTVRMDRQSSLGIDRQ